MLFPAIAVRVKGATPEHVFADTKGYSPQLLAIFILTFVQPIALDLLVTPALGRGIMVRGSAH